jgi:hypothetical protein
MAHAILDPESTEENGAPGGTRTHDLQVRNLTLYPLSYGRTRYNEPATSTANRHTLSKVQGGAPRRHWSEEAGGEGGIRTLGAGYPTQRFSKPSH